MSVLAKNVGKTQQIAEPFSAATPEGVLVLYNDSQRGVGPNEAVFRVLPAEGTVLDELKQLLGGEEANQLAGDWGSRCDINKSLEVAIDVAVLLDSLPKTIGQLGGDFQKAGKEFADGLVLSLLIARKLKKARGGEALSDAESALNQVLEGGLGIISRVGHGTRSDLGVLCIKRGRLRWERLHWNRTFPNAVPACSPLSLSHKIDS
jgi:hypothetical protein